ncbi:MAG: NAD(P)-dependent oxidoreductase [Bacteroidota bacterium]
MKHKLLITGGSGFVAYHIIEAALKQDYDVYVSIRSSSLTAHLKEFHLQFISLSFADKTALTEELKSQQFDYIIHTAGITKAANQQEYDKVNALYTSNLAEAAMGANIPLKKFVFVSSLAAIGPSNASETEDKPNRVNPVTGYGRSKLLAEHMLQNVPGLPLITIRPTAVYGPREKDILIILKTISKGLEPYIGNKPQQLSFVYVKDLATLIINALQSEIVHKTYNISDGNTYDRLALASVTKQIIGNKTIRFYLPLTIVKVMAGFLEATSAFSKKTPALNREKINELTASWICNIEPAKRDLNYMPVYDLQGGLKETLQWYKMNNWI